MMRSTVLAVLCCVASVALVEQRTVVLDVQGMNCAVCPITVKKALESVSGVEGAEVYYNTKTATIIFDSGKTTIDKIISATTNAGYPVTQQSMKHE